MNHLLESIVQRWPHLEPDQVNLIWDICRRHRLNPGLDLCISQRNERAGQILFLGVNGLKRFLESSKLAYLHQPDWVDSPRSVQVAVSTQFHEGTVRLSARVAAIDHPSMAGRPDQLERRAWQVLLTKLYQPLRVDLDHGDILAEPPLMQRPIDMPATSEGAPVPPRPAPQPAAKPAPKAHRATSARITIELATRNLLAEMRSSQLLAQDADDRWALSAILSTIYNTLGVESWNDGSMARQTAAAIIREIRTRHGPSPVAATGDKSRLTSYISQVIGRTGPIAAIAA
jgi:hypothetical protein